MRLCVLHILLIHTSNNAEYLEIPSRLALRENKNYVKNFIALQDIYEIIPYIRRVNAASVNFNSAYLLRTIFPKFYEILYP